MSADVSRTAQPFFARFGFVIVEQRRPVVRGGPESHAAEPVTRRSNRQGYGVATLPKLVERVEAEREQLFKAIAIVELCRLSAATLLETNEGECMSPALETTCDLLNTSAERLEWISADLQRLSQT